jgi:hypothetical protein
MRVSKRLYLGSFRLLFLVLVVISLCRNAVAQPNEATQKHSSLAEILLRKGILTPEEMRQVDAATIPEHDELLLARMLANKGVLTKAEFEQIAGKAPVSTAALMSAAPVAPAMAALPPLPVQHSAPTMAIQVSAQPSATIAAIYAASRLTVGRQHA